MGARTACALALMLALAALPPLPTLAATGSRDCRVAAERVLADLAIEPSEVESLRLVAQIKGGEKYEHVLSIDAWVRLAGRPGHLVIAFSPSCSLREVYTTGGLTLETVPGRD